MNEEQTGRDLAAAFHHLVEHEPPFRTDLDEALRAAARGGQRRRTRTLAVRGGAGLLALAASTALVLAWPQHDRSLPSPPAVVVPTETPTTVPVLTTEERLDQLVREIARPAGGQVRSVDRNTGEVEALVVVTTADGPFEVSASLSDDPGEVQTERQMCTSDDGYDGRTCATLWSKPSLGVWFRTYSTQPGRESVRLTAKVAGGRSLSVLVSNYVEAEDGVKTIGPRWKDCGLTVNGLIAAVTASGLTTDPTN